VAKHLPRVGLEGQANQISVIIFALGQRRQCFARHGEFGPARSFRPIAVGDFGEAGDDIIARTERLERQRSVVERFVCFQAVHIFGEQLQTDLARHAVRADDDGQRDGAILWQDQA
jgi:hypothetical protein